MNKIVDLTRYIKLGHQIGYNAIFYKSNKNEYLSVADKLITSKIIKKTIISKDCILIYTKNHIYKVPQGLSVYRISPEDLLFERQILSKK